MWISVDVGLPHDEKQVLFVYGGEVVAGYRYGKNWEFMSNETGDFSTVENGHDHWGKVTHWMPYPAPPKAGD